MTSVIYSQVKLSLNQCKSHFIYNMYSYIILLPKTVNVLSNMKFKGHSQLSIFSQAYKPYTRGRG